MVINSTNNAVSSINNLLQDKQIQRQLKHNRKSARKIIQFPSRQVYEEDIARTNIDSTGIDAITADFASSMYLHLLLVAGSHTLHRTRLLSNQA